MKKPIFVHSLFRSGSTYLFNAFRRSSADYWCYQEALHENAYFHRESPDLLSTDHGEEKRLLLRHPAGLGDYFFELRDAWPVWRDKIKSEAVYDGYFVPNGTDIGIGYWQSLIGAAKGRPVFQECRTSGRIGAIKEQLSGYHIYLWRDPWDQWWSYRVDPYFDLADQLIVTAPAPPPEVKILLDNLGIDLGREDSLAKSMALYAERPLPPEASYLVFYMLWCLGLREGLQQADLLLNVDRLTDSQRYRAKVLDQLAEIEVTGIEFSDCSIPQSFYFEEDYEFFRPLEDKVHQCLLEGSWSKEDLGAIQSLRNEHVPELREPSTGGEYNALLVEQLNRTRGLFIRLQRYLADRAEIYSERTTRLELQLRERDRILSELRAQQHETARAKEHLQNETKSLQAKLISSEALVDQLRNSVSWKLTRPLRAAVDIFQAIRKRIFRTDKA